MKDQTVSHNEQPAGVLESQSDPPQRILVVDDEPAILEISAAMLCHCGYEVDTAQDGDAGWKALLAKSYDLLITDQRMPKLSGIELMNKLRSENMALPVILVSGIIPTWELKNHPHLQFAAMLLKPFTIAE